MLRVSLGTHFGIMPLSNSAQSPESWTFYVYVLFNNCTNHQNLTEIGLLYQVQIQQGCKLKVETQCDPRQPQRHQRTKISWPHYV